jgi:ribose transport system substrate-binding protein
VSSALLANPDITVVMASFDGAMVAPINAAIKGLKKDKTVGIYGATGGAQAYIAQMDGTTQQKTDLSSSEAWRAYAAVDQTLRVVSGAGALPPDDEADPIRLFTTKNYKEAAGPEAGFGDAYVQGYESLWLNKK